jgi:hypothetical protein
MNRINQIVVGLLAVVALGACAGQSAAPSKVPSSGSVTIPVSAPPSTAGSSIVSSAVVVSSAPVILPLTSSSTGSSSPTSSNGAVPTSASHSTAPAQTSAPRSTTPVTPAPTDASPSSGRVPPVTGPTGRQLTLHGTVEEGVEPGCLLLKDTTTGLRYNLTGGNEAIVKVGATLTVVGVVRKDLRSYCQQGQILQVLQATAQ